MEDSNGVWRRAPEESKDEQAATTERMDDDSEDAPNRSSSSSGSAGPGVSDWRKKLRRNIERTSSESMQNRQSQK